MTRPPLIPNAAALIPPSVAWTMAVPVSDGALAVDVEFAPDMSAGVFAHDGRRIGLLVRDVDGSPTWLERGPLSDIAREMIAQRVREALDAIVWMGGRNWISVRDRRLCA